MRQVIRVFVKGWFSVLLPVMAASCIYSGIMGILFRPGWSKVALLWLGYGLMMQMTVGTLMAVVSTTFWWYHGRPMQWPPRSGSASADPGLTPIQE